MIKQRTYNLFTIIMLILCICTCLFSACSSGMAVADTTTQKVYTYVLNDLNKDENFSADNYVENTTDYSLNVIQIAESVDDELFVYVYQPSGEGVNFIATSINISTTTGNDLNYINYSLTYLNSSGVFYKYLVDDFTVSIDTERIYDISAIYRKYYTMFDGEVENDNTITEKAYEVAQVWSVYTEDGKTKYYNQETKVIEVTEKYVGFIRYSKYSIWTGVNACDAHFVAFSTDYEIEDLYEADITYITQTYKKTTDNGYFSSGGSASITEIATASSTTTTTYGDKTTVNDTLTYESKAGISISGSFIKYNYSWTRICSVSDFLIQLEEDDITLSTTAISALLTKKWVLRFCESEYAEWTDYVLNLPAYDYETGTKVSDVTILRLKYETDGIVYNLGVVDNKQIGSDEPTGESETLWDKFIRIVKIIFACILCVLILALLSPFLPTIISAIIWLIKKTIKVLCVCLKYIFKVVWYLLTVPLKIFD